MNRTFCSILALTLFVLLGPSNPASARMEPGEMRFGAGLGLRSTDEGLTFSAGATFGVFALQGLESGVDLYFQAGGSSATLFALSGYVRWVVLPDAFLSPYVRLGGGRLFIQDMGDAWLLSAGGGLVYWIGEWYGIDLGADYRWHLFADEIAGGFDTRIGLMFVF